MDFHVRTADIYVPNGTPQAEAVARTTQMGISAHQDDIEMMAYQGILECFNKADEGFTGVVVTDGSGSPRADLYAHYTNDQMKIARRKEQMKAAFVGDYCAQAFLDYPSAAVKDPSNAHVIEDLKNIILAASPRVVYTHNLADKHDTHVAVGLRVIRAIRSLPAPKRPQKLFGCEIWRDLDWLNDEDKAVFDVAAHENLAAALIGVHDSQICGGKRYDTAAIGRRKANATFFASHAVDVSTALAFAMDLTPLICDDDLDVERYVLGYIERFASEVSRKLRWAQGIG